MTLWILNIVGRWLINFTWVLVISHIWDFLFPSSLFLSSFPLSFLPLFSFVPQLLWLWLMTHLTASLLSTMGISSFLCSWTWSRGHWPQLAVELLWKSDVVLWTKDSHAELARAHCAPVLSVISPTGCHVISESVVYTGLTHCHSMDFAACLMLPQGQNKIIFTYKLTQVQESRAGHILARETLGMAPSSDSYFSPPFKNFSIGLIPDYDKSF